MFEKIGKKNAECFGKGSTENDDEDCEDDDDACDDDANNKHDGDGAIIMNIVEEVVAIKSNHYHQEQPLKLVDNEITVLKLLQSTSMTREMKITHLNTALSSVFPEVEDRSGALDASLAVHSHARPVRRVLRVSALAERCGGIACKSGASCCHMGSNSNIRRCGSRAHIPRQRSQTSGVSCGRKLATHTRHYKKNLRLTKHLNRTPIGVATI